MSDCRKCEWCKRGLVPLKKHSDWTTRRFHKKCYFEYLSLENLKAIWAKEDKEKAMIGNIGNSGLELVH